MKRDRIELLSDAEGASRQAPLYALITDVLRKAIASGAIEPGAVLLEGPLAELLHATRTPVRQALRALEDEGVVSRFDGRGFVAGPAGIEPKRVTLNAAMLGDGAAEPVRKTLGWEAIYDAVERDVVHLSVFGHYRLNELELARHFGVGRMVARDVLLRLESLGLTEKDDRLRWVVTPLDAKRISHLYELRWLVEPAALRAAMAAHPVSDVQPMIASLRRAIRLYPDVSRTALDQLEHDLHVGFLSKCPNPELLQSLQRTRCILTLSKHVLGEAAPMPKRDPFMLEHLAVFNAVAEGNQAGAADLLRTHLEASCRKVIARAAMVRESVALPDLPYAISS
jgi:DNA-binding GntR family transcriptional regulator